MQNKYHYLVENVGGGMQGMMFNNEEPVGWGYFVFPNLFMAERFIKENPQRKGNPSIVKVKVQKKQ